MPRWVLPTLVALFVMAGYLKGVPALLSLPIDLTLATGFVVWFAIGLRAVRTELLPRQILPVLVVFLVLAVPLLWTPFTEYGIQKEERLFLLTLPACLAPIVLFKTRAQLQHLILAFVGLASFVLATAILYPVPESDYPGAPVETLNVNTIGLGRTAGAVLVISALTLLHRSGRDRLIATAAIFASTFALLASGSRGPLLGVIVAIAVVLILSPRRPGLVLMLFVVLVVGSSIAYAFRSAPELSRARIVDVARGSEDRSSLERLSLFSIAREQIAAHPFGLGWGGFQGPAPGAYRYPHNLVLEVFVEAGWFPGLMVLGWIIITWLRARGRARDLQGSIAFALLTFTLVNALVSGDINDNRILFFALGIAIAIRRVSLAESQLATVGVNDDRRATD